MRTISAGEFKAKCLALMDEVHADGEVIAITKRGKTVAYLSAQPAGVVAQSRPLFGAQVGALEIVGDVIESPYSDEQWEQMETDSWPKSSGEPAA